MKTVVWLLVVAVLGFFAHALWRWHERWREQQRNSEARMADLLAQVRPSPSGDPTLAQQKLLFEAAAKTGEAGEPALAVELYGRLLARFPQGPFADQARNAIETQKRKLGNV